MLFAACPFVFFLLVLSAFFSFLNIVTSKLVFCFSLMFGSRVQVTMNFIIAGRDTTAQTLSWFLYEMTRCDKDGNKVNATVENKIREEIKTVLSKHGQTGYVCAIPIPLLIRSSFVILLVVLFRNQHKDW